MILHIDSAVKKVLKIENFPVGKDLQRLLNSTWRLLQCWPKVTQLHTEHSVPCWQDITGLALLKLRIKKTLQKEKAALTFISFSGFSMELFFFFKAFFWSWETRRKYTGCLFCCIFTFTFPILSYHSLQLCERVWIFHFNKHQNKSWDTVISKHESTSLPTVFLLGGLKS